MINFKITNFTYLTQCNLFEKIVNNCYKLKLNNNEIN